MSENKENQSIDEFKRELRNKVIQAIVAGVVAIIVAIGAATLTLVSNLPGSVGIVPRGAVAAFDLEACPTGWSPFAHAWGRFIVGAVSTADLGKIPGDFRQDDGGANLVERTFGLPGGEQAHILLPNEIPEHRHFLAADVGEDGRNNVLTQSNTIKITDGAAVGHDPWYILRGTSEVATLGLSSAFGGSEAHNNMPPYVALHYCRKD